VPARLKIADASGTDAEGAYNEYAVGLNDPSADPVIQPIPVDLTRQGRAVKGEVYLVFPQGKALGGGQIYYTTTGTNGGPCDLKFDIKQA